MIGTLVRFDLRVIGTLILFDLLLAGTLVLFDSGLIGTLALFQSRRGLRGRRCELFVVVIVFLKL